VFQQLVDPGPDVVVVDEAHTLRNSKSNITLALQVLRSATQRSLAQRTLMLSVVHAHAGRQELCTLRVLTFAKLNHARCSASALNGASRSRALRCKTT
jgi:hypothetical protein